MGKLGDDGMKFKVDMKNHMNYTHTHACTCTHTHIHMYVRTQTHTHMHAHACTHTRTHTHTTQSGHASVHYIRNIPVCVCVVYLNALAFVHTCVSILLLQINIVLCVQML